MKIVWRLLACICVWYAHSLANLQDVEDLSCSHHFSVLFDHNEDTHDFLIVVTSQEDEIVVKELRALFSDDLTSQRINVKVIHSTDATKRSMIHCAPMKKDRTCLVSPPVEPKRISTSFPKHLPFELSSLAEFINAQAILFRNPVDGSLTSFGSYVERLQSELFSVTQHREECSRIPYSSIVNDPLVFVQEYWLKQRPVIVEGFPINLCQGIHTTNESTSLSSSRCLLELLVSQYAEQSVGVKLSPSTDFEGNSNTLPPYHHFHFLFFPPPVHIHLSHFLSTKFKGIDLLSNWGMANTQDVPPNVLAKMESPHLVVVRAKHEDMKLGLVLDLIEEGGKQRHRQQRSEDQTLSATKNNSSMLTASTTANAYVEYLPLSSLPNLLKRVLPVHELPSLLGFPNDGLGFNQQCDRHRQQCINGTRVGNLPPLLKGGKPHFWLGDGRTVGKLHFDQFDNLLVQLVGSKKFFLLDPTHNERLREGHMREALLGAQVTYYHRDQHGAVRREKEDEHDSKKVLLTSDEAASRPYQDVRVSVTNFKKHTLTESTSMVHSPVAMDFGGSIPSDLPHMECHVHAGEMLFVPSFWWHEVQSSPGELVTTASTTIDTGLDDHHRHMQYNAAINIWYTPLFDKNFPCPLCKKSLNLGAYTHELETLIQFTSKNQSD